MILFITHVNNAVAYNLPYGIYYYAHAAIIDKAITEANWVDKQIKTYLNGQNPHWASGMMQKINLCSSIISM